MAILLSSPARLADPETLSLLVLHFSRHLGQRYADRVAGDTRVLCEEDRLSIVPLVFGLLPRSAVIRASYDVPVKPLLKSHLENFGVAPCRDLLDVLKSVADQYYRTTPGLNRPRKFGIADLKAIDFRRYRELLSRQEGRCVYCGLMFNGNEEETLDHVIPWRLVGDVGDGTNWQIICRECNVGKSSFLSSLQTIESLNWIYDMSLEGVSFDVSLRTRFALLVQQPRCSESGCTHTPKSERLYVIPRLKDALPVVDHHHVVCEVHIPV